MFEIYNEDYLIDSMILGASQNTTTRLGIVEFPMDQYKQIPYIRFPRFSDVGNYNALSMAQQVLIEAYKRTDIPYGEVAITYDGETNEQIEKENCAIVYGTYDEVHFLSDKKTQTIINNAKKHQWCPYITIQMTQRHLYMILCFFPRRHKYYYLKLFILMGNWILHYATKQYH